MLTFDPITHEYRINGKSVPSVTQILAGMGIIDSRWHNEEARLRGQAVHAAIHLENQGVLDEDSVCVAVKPFLAAYRRFRAESHMTLATSETPVADICELYAGTPDLTGTLNQRAVVIDVKTGSTMPAWAALQTVAYANCWLVPHLRFGLQLRDNGTYRLEPFTDRTDLRVWRGLVSAWHWRKQHQQGGPE